MRDEDEAPRRRKRPDSGDLRLDSPLTEMDGVKEPKRRRQAVRLGVAVAGAAVLGAAAHLGVGSALTSVLSTDSSASSPSPSADPASSNTSSIPVLDQDPESPPPGSVWYREDLGVLRMQSGLFGVLTLANLDPTVGYVKALPDKTSLAGLTVLSAGVSDTELLGISPTGGLLLDPTNALGVYTKNNTLDDTHGNMVAVGSVTAANFVGELDTAKLGAEPFLFGAFASGQFLYFNGTDWVNEPLSSVAVTSLNGLTGAVTIRAGNAGIAVATSSPDINISLAELDVGTLGGGAFSMAALAAGQLLYYNGTDWVNTPLVAGTGIGVSGLTISNTGVLSLNGSTGALTLVAGTAISISGLTITNTGVTSAVAGNGVSVSSATGAVTYSLVLNGTTLSLGTGGLSVNLANANVWTGVQTFPAASLTNAELAGPVVTGLTTVTAVGLTLTASGSGVGAYAYTPSVTFGGDVLGTSFSSMTVAGIRGVSVVITSLTTGNILQYNGTDWVNVAPGSVSVTSLNGLTGAITLQSPGSTLTVTTSSPDIDLDIDLAHANTWTGVQSFPAASIPNATLAGPLVTGLATETAAGITLTASGSGVGTYAYTPSVSLGGDLSGSSLAAATLYAIQGIPVVITTLAVGNFLYYNGTDWVNQSLAAGQGISVSGYTVTNTGVLSLQGSTGALSLTAGTGIGISSLTITNTGVTSLVAGTNVSLSAATGAVTVSVVNAPTFSGIVTMEGGATFPGVASSNTATVENSPTIDLLGSYWNGTASIPYGSRLYWVQSATTPAGRLSFNLNNNGTITEVFAIDQAGNVTVGTWQATAVANAYLAGPLVDSISVVASGGITQSVSNPAGVGATTLTLGLSAVPNSSLAGPLVSSLTTVTAAGITLTATNPSGVGAGYYTPSVSIGGDLSGSTLSSLTVAKLQTYTLTISAPSANEVLVYNGTDWVNASVPATAGVTSLNGLTGALSIAAGNAGITVGTSGSDVNVSLAELDAGTLDGKAFSFSVLASGNLLEYNGTDWVNASLVAGTAISVSGLTITNTGVTSAVAGTGISVSAATGAVTITNTGIISLSAGTGVAISGTNPATISLSGNFVTSLTTESGSGITLTATNPSGLGAAYYVPSITSNLDVGAFGILFSAIADSSVSGKLFLSSTTANAMKYYDTQATPVLHQLATLDAGSIPNSALAGSLVDSVSVAVSGGLTQSVSGPSGVGSVTITLGIAAGGIANASLAGPLVTGLTTVTAAGITLTASGSGVGAYAYTPSVTLGGDLSGSSLGAATLYAIQSVPIVITTLTSGQVLQYNGTDWVNAAIPSAPVSSVSNSDGTLTISPTTGAVVASLNLAHANTWTATQTFPSGSLTNTELAGPVVTGLTTESGAGITLTASGSGVGAYAYTPSITGNLVVGAYGVVLDAIADASTAGKLFLSSTTANTLKFYDTQATPALHVLVDSLNVGSYAVTSIVAGTAISVSGSTGAVTVTNTGVTSAVAGNGVAVSSATGAVTFSAVLNGSTLSLASTGLSLNLGNANTWSAVQTFGTNLSFLGAQVSGTIATGDFLYYNGTNWIGQSLGAGTGISVSGATITNTGVTSAVAGTGISVSAATGAVTFTNTGVTSAVAGTNITVSAATGAVTIGTSLTPAFTSVALNGSTSGTLTMNVPSTVTSYTLTWPSAVASANGQVLTSTTAGVLSWATIVSGVSSVSNSDGTLTISPTTGAVVASLNLAHANTWTGVQTFPAGSIANSVLAGPLVTGLTTETAAGITLTASGSGVGAYAYTPSVSLGGDVSGSSLSAITVSAIRGTTVTITTLTTGDFLYYNGTAWVNQALAAGSGISVSDYTITNTGVLSIVAGTGIAVSGATGNVTVNASAVPNTSLSGPLVSSITAGTNISSVNPSGVGAATVNVVDNPTFSGLVTANAGLTLNGSQPIISNPTPSTSLATTENSGYVDILGSYWNGSASVPYGFRIYTDVTATTPTANLTIELNDNGTITSLLTITQGGIISSGTWQATAIANAYLAGPIATGLTTETGAGITLTASGSGVGAYAYTPSVSLGGDLSGSSLSAVTVAKIQSVPIVITTLTSGQVLQYNGTDWVNAAIPSAPVSSVSNSDGTLTISPTTGAVVASLNLGHANTWTALQTFGTDLSFLGAQVSGTIATGDFLYYNGTNWVGQTLAGGTGISVSDYTITNTGVTSAVAGTGIGVSAATGAVTFTNTGVTSVAAGTGISVSGATGAVTVSLSGNFVTSLTTESGAGITLTATNPTGLGAAYYVPSITGNLNVGAFGILLAGIADVSTSGLLFLSSTTANTLKFYDTQATPALHVLVDSLNVGSYAVTGLTGGTGISISGTTGGVTVTNTGVTSAVAGTGVSVSAATGAVTFSLSGNFVTSLTTETAAGITLTATNPTGLGAAYYTPSVSLGGDVSGSSLSAVTVAAIRGTSVSITTLTTGDFLYYNGTDWVNQSLAAGSGISISDYTITNAGVTSAVAGAGIGVSAATGAVTFTNTGVTSAVAGTGISVSAATGAVTISLSGNFVTSLTTESGSGITLTATNPTGLGAAYYVPSITGNLGVGGFGILFTGIADASTSGKLFLSSTTANTLKFYDTQATPVLHVIVDSLNVGSYAVTGLVGGTGISISGSTGSVTVTNSGVTSAVAGTGISVSAATGAVTFTNSGVTSVTAGTGISVSAATGGVTISISSVPNSSLSGPLVSSLTTESGSGITLTATNPAGVGAAYYVPSITGNLSVGGYGVVFSGIADASVAGMLYLSSTTANTLKFYDTQATPVLHTILDSVNVGSYAVTSLVAGTAIGISGGTGAVTVTNTGVTSAVAGTGISVSAATGAVTISLSGNFVTSLTTESGAGITLTATNPSGLGAAYYVPSVTLGGDLSGSSLGAATVAKISGVPVSFTSIAVGNFLYYNGTDIINQSLAAGTGISISDYTITNSGVTSLVAGTAISVSAATGAVTVTNTGVTSLAAGTGVSVSASTGAVTVSLSGNFVTSLTTESGSGITLTATNPSGLGAAYYVPSITGNLNVGGYGILFTGIADASTSGKLFLSSTTANTLKFYDTQATPALHILVDSLNVGSYAVTGLVAGTAISISGTTGSVTVTNTGVTSAVAGNGISVSAATGAVTFSAVLNGTTLSLGSSGLSLNLGNANTWTAVQTFGTDISFMGEQVSGSTITAGSFLYDNGTNWVRQSLAAGTGISVSDYTITNSGVTSLAAGNAGVTVSASTGAVSVSLAELDVGTISGKSISITSLASGQALVYNGTDWVNESVASGTFVASLNTLTGALALTSPTSTLTIGTSGSDVTVDLNLGNANTWTASQTVGNGTAAAYYLSVRANWGGVTNPIGSAPNTGAYFGWNYTNGSAETDLVAQTNGATGNSAAFNFYLASTTGSLTLLASIHANGGMYSLKNTLDDGSGNMTVSGTGLTMSSFSSSNTAMVDFSLDSNAGGTGTNAQKYYWARRANTSFGHGTNVDYALAIYNGTIWVEGIGFDYTNSQMSTDLGLVVGGPATFDAKILQSTSSTGSDGMWQEWNWLGGDSLSNAYAGSLLFSVNGNSLWELATAGVSTNSTGGLTAGVVEFYSYSLGTGVLNMNLFTGAVSLGGALSLSSHMILLSGNETSAGFQNDIQITDTGASSGQHKFIRSFGGQFQVINSAYTVALLSLDDSGNMTVPGTLGLSGLATFNAGITGTGTTGALQPGTGMLGNANTWTALQTFSGGISAKGIVSSVTAFINVKYNSSSTYTTSSITAGPMGTYLIFAQFVSSGATGGVTFYQDGTTQYWESLQESTVANFHIGQTSGGAAQGTAGYPLVLQMVSSGFTPGTGHTFGWSAGDLYSYDVIIIAL